MDGFFNFDRHPGNLYVIATLLPLLSFVLLLLWNAVRAYLLKHYDPEKKDLVYTLYHGLDGPGRTRIGAYIATGAIFLAFCLVLTGFVLFLADQDPLTVIALEDDNGNEKKLSQILHEHDYYMETRWKGNFRWAWLSVATDEQSSGLELADSKRASVLSLGYHIDHLSGIMFLMVTFIATLIHLFSIGYMSEELDKTVEDHHVHTEGGHLKRRGRFTQFFMFLSLFCFSMLNLILANNLFQVFLSWELVGICSFLLIGFYYERTSASNAANKAFITNRIGDAGFIIGLLIIWTYVGSFNFDDIFKRLRSPEQDAHKEHKLDLRGQIVRARIAEGQNPEKTPSEDFDFYDLNRSEPVRLDDYAILFPLNQKGHFHGVKPGKGVFARGHPQQGIDTDDPEQAIPGDYGYMPYWLLVLAGLGIFLGCVGKSAQFPLQVWLPDAMEGPTPVSALIHAATMVAAGVYLVGRVYPLFTPEVLLVIAYVGAITLFVAATIAIVMTDIKKVLAYSTVSQLGYMMLALGIGGWVAGLLHLLTHAFFKALLFLGSGSVIYGCHHEQEMTKMGGLLPKMRITAITMLVGVLAIAGLPLLSGWYSKDAIIAQGFGFGTIFPKHFLLLLLPLVTAGITTFYMFRMWFMTFTGEPRDQHVHEHAHESPWTMTVPLIVLAVFSVIVAWPNFMAGDGLWHAEKSWLGQQLEHSQYASVTTDFGDPHHPHGAEHSHGPAGIAERRAEVAHQAHAYHTLGGIVALLMVVIGFAFAAAIYWFKMLDPAETKQQAYAVWNLLAKKWYFDELYSALIVRPALVVSGWCKAFDTYVIDGILHTVARLTIVASWLGGLSDRYIVDGLANKIADVCQGMGARLRRVQTGFLRSYVLFLALAAVGLFALLALVTGVLSAGL